MRCTVADHLAYSFRLLVLQRQPPQEPMRVVINTDEEPWKNAVSVKFYLSVNSNKSLGSCLLVVVLAVNSSAVTDLARSCLHHNALETCL